MTTNVEIQNTGISQTISSVNGKQHMDQIKWDTDSDGKKANVSFDLTKDNKTEHINVQLDKHDLAKMLSMTTVNKPIEKRLLSDFSRKRKQLPLEQMMIEIDYPLFKKVEQNPRLLEDPLFKKVEQNPRLLEGQNEVPNQLFEELTHISSPFANEKFIVPVRKSSLKKRRAKSSLKKRRAKSTFPKSGAKSKKSR